MKRFRQTLLAATVAVLGATALPVGTALAQPAYATASAMPRITAFDVKSVGRVEAGTELDFTLWGTPGSQAVLHIDGAQRTLAMSETAPGRYEGTYTVGRRDQIGAQSKVTANLRNGNRVSTALLSEPLQQGWPSPLAAAATPQIDSLSVSNDPGRRARDRLRFTLRGTPGGHASVAIAGSDPTTLTLDETRPGEYTGTYTVPRGAAVDTTHGVQARLRVGDRSTLTTVAHAYDQVQWNDRRPVACLDCGRVEAVNRVEVDGDGRVIGTLAGGVLGAVVGSQFGKGNGRTAAGVAGAVGGALLGREIERRANRHTQYEVVVRTQSGERKSVLYEDEPPVKVGDAVRIVGDTLEPRRG